MDITIEGFHRWMFRKLSIPAVFYQARGGKLFALPEERVRKFLDLMIGSIPIGLSHSQLSEGLQNSSQQDSEFYTEQQNLNNSQGQLLA
jgi:hypothetical protein